jgi:hypothetical protein
MVGHQHNLPPVLYVSLKFSLVLSIHSSLIEPIYCL